MGLKFCSYNVAQKIHLIVVVLLVACTVLAGFGQYGQGFEILSHLVSLYCIALVALLPLFVLLKSRLGFCLAVGALLINFFRMAPAFTADAVGPKKSSVVAGQPVSILAFNCERDLNSDPQIFGQIVAARNADILCLSEVDATWKKLFEKDYSQYPYRQICANNFGVACLSKYPIEFSQIRFSQYNNHPRLICVFKLPDGKSLTGLIVHPSIPLNTRSYESRNSDFKIFAEDLAPVAGPKFIVGDMNCSPWSFYFDILLSDTKLKDAMNGFGLQSTWSPKWLHLPLVPIDHCLVSSDVKVADYKIERDAGSDHRPLYVNLVVPAK